MHSLSITQTARSYPRLPYQAIKDDILGASYTLSLVFVGAQRAAAINAQTRNKSYVPNVLSFPLTSSHGEIIITPVLAAKESKRFDLSPRGYIGFLYIHGLLHLKGFDHGKEMDQLEQKYLKKYALK